jgi:hypothetical protein
MSRLRAPRATTAVAVVAAIVAVLAVMFPGLGFSQTTSSHGGSPSDVYTQTNSNDTCMSPSPNGTSALEQFFDVGAESHVVVYFTFEWARLNTHEVGHISMGLDGRPETEVPSEPWRFSGTVSTQTTGTVMWTFDNVAPGHHRVNVFAYVTFLGTDAGKPSADLNGCALTLFVTPVAV